MAYTINHGYHQERRLDWLQRGLLIGLPVLALILIFGSLRSNNSRGGTTSHNPKLIPIISSLSDGSGTGTSGTRGANSGSSSLGGSPSAGTNTSSLSGTASNTGGSTVTSSGSTTPIVGGRGGGPTGGTSGSTGGSTSGSGGTVSIPDCSLDQIATVTCQVPACSPEVTLQPGQKAILGIGGTCIVVN